MTKKMEIYKCEICGNIVEMLHEGDGELVCGAPMKVFQENTVDATKEKHIPIIETIAGGFRVNVGSVDHPMEEKHHIEWIEILTDDGRVYRQFLQPGTKPLAIFKLESGQITAREYCNLHDLWKG